MTFGAWWGDAVIVSRTDIGTDPALNETLAHEYGHVAQVNTLGPAYAPANLIGWAPALLNYGIFAIASPDDGVSLHDWNPMEIHAQSTVRSAPLFPSSKR